MLDVISKGAASDAAILAPERPVLTFGALRALAKDTIARLNALGIGRGDRVAIVLPNGPEMAAAFVAIAAGATTAPLNPAYRAEEFEFYLTDLRARALVLDVAGRSTARGVATKLGMPVVRLGSTPMHRLENFTLPDRELAASAGPMGPAGLDDIALVLHTSGTTSRPKIVPLTGAQHRRVGGAHPRTLALTADDRCLNIMPLFHIHGLIAAVLSSLAAGGSICLHAGLQRAASFFQWLDRGEADLVHGGADHASGDPRACAAQRRRAWRSAALRFIRSSSSSLPPQVMAELEAAFGCPVIEAYGMTEAAHQMASNPLPPGARKPGSVGPAAGPEMAIMDDDGALLPAGETGEIVIRGPNVTAGYENNPKANAEAFAHGWFRTGDQGVMDEEGYLRITGRLKEIINRGGEKISPREVDEVLMDHPAVAQVVTFAMPHDKLGEEVAAAVVLREGISASEREIRDFAAGAARRLQGAAQDRVSRRDPEGRDRQAAAHRPCRQSSGFDDEDHAFSAPARSADYLGAKLAIAGEPR